MKKYFLIFYFCIAMPLQANLTPKALGYVFYTGFLGVGTLDYAAKTVQNLHKDGLKNGFFKGCANLSCVLALGYATRYTLQSAHRELNGSEGNFELFGSSDKISSYSGVGYALYAGLFMVLTHTISIAAKKYLDQNRLKGYALAGKSYALGFAGLYCLLSALGNTFNLQEETV